MELLPREQIAFQRMLDVIRRNYERFGFLPVETPVFELSDVLLTKSGGETERQVYFVQSTGALANAAAEGDKGDGGLPELALRFDLTVPLARYVAEHEHELSFPFRRYQMQRVYRGERAQRGRFREFYQCDIDVIGKDALSIRYDAEVLAVIHAVFSELGIGAFRVQLNNRKLMRGFFEAQGVADPQQQALVLREVDKIDKRGADYVRETLAGPDFGLPVAAVERILAFVEVRSQSHEDALVCIAQVLADAGDAASETLRQGANELREVLALVKALGVPEAAYCLNFSIARGLDYYTGTVYETQLVEHPGIGSICSGGRYEDLASHYTKSRLPGVGISIGLTRLFWQLREAGLVEGIAESSVQAMVALMDEGQLDQVLDIARHLRAGGINTEVQMEPRKVGKQFQYASRAGIRFVVLAGEDELARGVVAVKDLLREQQFEVARDELAGTLRVELEQARALAGR
jgi:histidyl-tRNA synthetase